MKHDRQSTEDALRRAFLNAYPNPQRIGCPVRATLKALAEGREPDTDDLTEHMSQCSPCTREFLEFQNAWRKRRTWRAAIIGGLAAVAAAIVIWLLLPKGTVTPRERMPTTIRVVAFLDFREGATRAAENRPPPKTISPKTNELQILLPRGSETGAYTLVLQNASHLGRDLAVFPANAEAGSDGLVSVRVQVNLKRFAPGEYVLVWRHAGSEGYGSVMISR